MSTLRTLVFHKRCNINRGLKTTRQTQQAKTGHGVPNSPFLSISHMNNSQGMKPTGPHSTSTAMSDLEKPKAWTAEFWMGPQKFHIIPCMKPSRENKHRTSHLLPYTRLWTGWPFVVALVGVRRGSLSPSVLGPAPMAAVWRSVRFEYWFLLRAAVESRRGARTWVELKTKTADGLCCCNERACACLGGNGVIRNRGPPAAILARVAPWRREFSGATAEPKWSRFPLLAGRSKYVRKPNTIMWRLFTSALGLLHVLLERRASCSCAFPPKDPSRFPKAILNANNRSVASSRYRRQGHSGRSTGDIGNEETTGRGTLYFQIWFKNSFSIHRQQCFAKCMLESIFSTNKFNRFSAKHSYSK